MKPSKELLMDAFKVFFGSAVVVVILTILANIVIFGLCCFIAVKVFYMVSQDYEQVPRVKVVDMGDD